MVTFYKWKRASKRAKPIKTVVTNGENNSVEVHIAWKTPGLKNSVSTYRIYPDRRIYVYHSAVPKANMIKFGARMVLDGKMEYVDWYGRGPVPTYCDRKTGAKIGKYSSTVTDLEYRYMRPQESSNRADVRCFTIKDENGIGFKISSYYNDPFNFSAYHYTTEKLDKAKHVHEIPYDNSITTVNIDHLLCGVGGDMPGQAFVRDQYLMKKGVKQSYSFTIEPIRAGE